MENKQKLEILDSIWAQLNNAASDRCHPYRLISVATIVEDKPEVRTVVLRGLDQQQKKDLVSYRSKKF